MREGQILIYWYGTVINDPFKMMDLLSDEQYQGLLRLYKDSVTGNFPDTRFDKIINTDNKLIGYGAILRYNDKVLVHHNHLPAIKIFIEDMFYQFRQEYKVRFYRDQTGSFLKDNQTIVNIDRYPYLD